MNPQDPLAKLHPLREPALVGWWPPAPGWWLLSGLVLLCLVALIWFLLRRYRANAYRRQALAQLQQLQEAYPQQPGTAEQSARINALLKSVALRAYPRREVAATTGSAWLQFLNSKVRRGERFQSGFASAAYYRECPDLDMEQLYLAARNWIKRHEVAR